MLGKIFIFTTPTNWRNCQLLKWKKSLNGETEKKVLNIFSHITLILSIILPTTQY